MIPDDAVALVAGASRGIGRAIAFHLLGASIEMFMVGRSLTRLAEPVLPEEMRGRCHFVAAHLTDDDAVQRAAAMKRG